MGIFKKKLALIILTLLLCFAVTGCSFVNRGASFLSRVTTEHGERIVSCADTEKFYYEALSEEKQRDYRILLAAYERMDDEVCGLSASVDEMTELTKFIILDCPELFWVANSGLYYNENITPILYVGGIYTPRYRYTREQAVEMKEKVEKTCDAFVAEHKNESDYEKVLAAYDYIIDITDYDDASARNIVSNEEYNPVEDNSQCITSVFIDGLSVCAGYSAAYQYLLSRLGVFSTSVIGKAPGTKDGTMYNHQWNLVRPDGEYYYTDITWGEPLTKTDPVRYDYFCVTGEEISSTHKANEWVEYPKTDSVKCNYCYREGGYFTDLDLSAIGNLIVRSVLGGERSLTMKFRNASDYEAVGEYLKTGAGRAKTLESDFILASELNGCFKVEKTTYGFLPDLNIIRLKFTCDDGGDK